jgi:hypothetical protein
MKMQHVSTIALALILTACASTKPANVMPLTGGQYKTTGMAASQDDAQKAALDAAAETCSKRNLRHVVQNETTAYKGVVSEDTNKNLQAVSAVLSWTRFRGIPTLSGDDDYQVTLTFTCES